jgi:sterol desaturase/sphingolipid hydroxylase (fatty acid hydroxylase superfamily)
MLSSYGSTRMAHGCLYASLHGLDRALWCEKRATITGLLNEVADIMSRTRNSWGALLLVAAGAAIALAERRRTLRQSKHDVRERAGERMATNLAIAGVTAAVTHVAMSPVVRPLAEQAQRKQRGLVQRLPLSPLIRDALAVLLLDYTLYLWHVVEHRVSWIYRFHQVHHADLELDASTALRFHFGEFLLSVPWRAAQIALIGVSPRALRTWERLTMMSVLFHHANLRLPIAWERRIAMFVTTPRLHGIHHSVVREDQDSNWSSGLTLWDRIHGTYRANVPQDSIEIGVPALRDPDDVTLGRSLAMPLRPIPPWRMPDGSVPSHHSSHAPQDRLLE